MSIAYDSKLERFIEGKIFTRLSLSVRNRADAHCDACGSLEPRILFGMKDKESDGYFFIGSECLRWICQNGKVEKRFNKESASKAYEREMAMRRSEEEIDDNCSRTLREIQRYEYTPVRDANMSYYQPQIYLWETAESYLAIIQICYQGILTYGSAETPRFEEIWERQGNGEAILKRVLRNPSQAVRECVDAATKDAQRKYASVKEKRINGSTSSGNGHHDWTSFWKTIRDLNLDRDEVVALINGLTPRHWLDKHPGSSLDNLLQIIQKKHDHKMVCSSALGNAEIELAEQHA